MTRCDHCGADVDKGREIDPCIGPVPGAYSACCGHGNSEHASILYGQPGRCERKLVGQAAVEELDRLRASGAW